MFIVLSQRIDTVSNYDDKVYSIYHFPHKYRNQIAPGDIFIYYQGDRYKRENRYYFGTGIIGRIYNSPGGDCYAELLDCKQFGNHVPIYLPEGGYIEQKGYTSIRNSLNPPWQSSVRPLSHDAYLYITYNAGILKPIFTNCDIDILKSQLKKAIKEFYIGGVDTAILDVIDISEQIARAKNIAFCSTDKNNNLKPMAKPENSQLLHEEKTIGRQNIQLKDEFFNYCKNLRMARSYKPLLILAIFENNNDNGCVTINEAVEYFSKYYNLRRDNNMKIEKGNCIYLKYDKNTKEKIADNIMKNPIRALLLSGFFSLDVAKSSFGLNLELWTILSEEEKKLIRELCNCKLDKYYASK